MPNFRRVHQFVSYVHSHNTKDVDEDGTLGNLVDPNYFDVKAIKEDNALRIFQTKTQLPKEIVADIYQDARSLKLVERRDSSNSTHIQGVGIVLTDEGRHFLERSRLFGWKKGMWHIMFKYYSPWSLPISLLALVVAAIALFVKGK